MQEPIQGRGGGSTETIDIKLSSSPWCRQPLPSLHPFNLLASLLQVSLAENYQLSLQEPLLAGRVLTP